MPTTIILCDLIILGSISIVSVALVCESTVLTTCHSVQKQAVAFNLILLRGGMVLY